MILKRTLSVLFGSLIGLITLYILQGACFRLVESYANNRLKWAWGNYIQGTIDPKLSKLPLDHFVQPPKENSSVPLLVHLTNENDYSQKVFSFALPLRDRFLNFVRSEEDTLRNYEIRDLQMIRGVASPGLRRAALLEDVRDGIARREGDLIEYADACFLFVIDDKSTTGYEEKFASLETTFGFLLRNGMACSLLPADSLEDLMGKVSYLKANHGLLAENLIVYGEGQTAALIMEACFARPEFYRGVIAVNPSRPVPAPNLKSKTWFLGITDGDLHLDDVKCSMILDWVRIGRQSEYLYPSRLGGLLRTNLQNEDLPIPSLAIAYAVQCNRYFKEASVLLPVAPAQVQGDTHHDLVESIGIRTEEGGIQAKRAADPLPEAMEDEPKFDCQMVSEYREIHENDPEVNRLSNRELVLRIGDSLKEMGEQVMSQVEEKDPLFMRFYLSLKELSVNSTE